MKFVKPVLVLVLCMAMLVSQTACNSANTLQIVNMVVAELPTAIQLATALIPLITPLLAAKNIDPSVGAQVTTVGNDVLASLHELQTLTNAYLAHPDKGVFQQIVDLVDAMVVETDGTLLNVAHIKDANTQAVVTAAVAGLSTALHLIDSYLMQTQTPTQLKARAATRKVKLNQIKSYLNQPLLEQKAQAQGTSFAKVYQTETALGF